MDVQALYQIVSSGLVGVVVLILVMAYLSFKGVIVSGKQYEAMEKDRSYWRDVALRAINELEPKLSRLADEPPATPIVKPPLVPPPASAPPDEVAS